MVRYLLLLLFVISLVAGTGTLAQEDAGLAVDAGQVIGPISPYVYGSNFGPLQVVPVDLIEQAKVSGVSMLRFPGGRWGDQNNIRHEQIDAFMRTCELVGAEPSIHVRLEGGTPEAAAELVQYTNVEKGYDVKYWAIGNEPNLFDDYTTEDLNREWRPIAEAMLEVDPNIILIGPDTSQYSGNPDTDPRDPEGRDWVREFLLANGDLVDIVAVHRYPFPRSMSNPIITIDDLRQNVTEWNLILPALRAVIKETTGRDDIPVAVTEANSHWSSSIGGEATPDSFYNAIWWADVLGRLIQDQSVIVNYFDFQSHGGRGGWGLLARYEVRPTYYTYQLYQHFGTELVFSESTVADLSIYAALRDDGALTLLVVNLADDPQTSSLEVANFEITGPAEVWRLDAEHMAEQLDDEDLSGFEITVPGQSATLYILQPS
ncbi:MAG: hypothetical protein JXJ20_06885 [Anaerolineae bacterium]|nr:hypothetical protein [Anaerolineae bacterium]